tara:strand:+ start:15522 stop:15734 length:213 start_codon:yes stop_codon:yes gene_type:complete
MTEPTEEEERTLKAEHTFLYATDLPSPRTAERDQERDPARAAPDQIQNPKQSTWATPHQSKIQPPPAPAK